MSLTQIVNGVPLFLDHANADNVYHTIRHDGPMTDRDFRQ